MPRTIAASLLKAIQSLKTRGRSSQNSGRCSKNRQVKKLRNAIWNVLLDIGLAIVPRWERPTLLRVARAFGWLFYVLGIHQRRVALANTRIVFGKERPDLVRKSFTTFATTILEIFWSQRLNAQTVGEVVDIDEGGWELAQTLSKRGKGVIAINLHFSNWEMMGMALAWRGAKISYIAVPTKNPKMDEILNASRMASGLQIIWRRGAGMKLLRALKRGEAISMMMDINVSPAHGGIWVNFCGLPVCVSSLTATLAQRTGASLVGAICLSQPNGRYRVVFGPEIQCRPQDDPREVTQQIMRFAEEAMRQHPEDWWWVYKRWKYRPEGSDLPYPFYSKPTPREDALSESAEAEESTA